MNWNSTEFVWLDWTVLAIGVVGVIWAVWHAIVKDIVVMSSLPEQILIQFCKLHFLSHPEIPPLIQN